MPIALVPAALAAGGTVAFLATGLLAARAFGNARVLEAAAPTPIAALEPGLHEVAGTLGAAETRAAPVSGAPCAYWRLVVEEQRGFGWVVLVDAREAAAATVADTTGAQAVALLEAEVVVSAPARVRSGIHAADAPELAALFARFLPASAPTGPFVRWREEVLLPGDAVHVIGLVERDETRIALVAPEEGALVVSDRSTADVARHERRAGRRWGLSAGACFLVAAASGLLTVLQSG